MRLAALGSGSAGNGTLVATDDTLVLVDCGYSAKIVEERAALLGFDAADIDAIVITHEHDDHIAGVAPLAKKYGMPVYATAGSFASGKARLGKIEDSRIFSQHAAFEIGDLRVRPVPVPHDAREPCQFVFEHAGRQLGILTDIGTITPHVIAEYRECDGLFVEFNHDPARLQTCAYPARLKRRIAGFYGHLSNGQALEFLGNFTAGRLKRIVAGHLSQRTNDHETVAALLGPAAAELGAEYAIAAQDEVLEWMEI